jgi:hypothetical protein
MMIHDIFRIIAGHIRPERQTVTAGAIWKLIDRNHPVVQFTRMCIAANTGKTRCYFDARAAGVAVRKQVQLALYEYLKSEEAPPPISVFCYPDNLGASGWNYVGVTLYFIEKEAMGFFGDVQEHFADQFELHTGLDYEASGLSTCDADDIRIVSDVKEHDFIFEVGDLKSGKLKYWGYWHRKKWDRIHIFEDFDMIPLNRLLRAR